VWGMGSVGVWGDVFLTLNSELATIHYPQDMIRIDRVEV
jgi:hypothetical protein